jgi:hypothetical protein
LDPSRAGGATLACRTCVLVLPPNHSNERSLHKTGSMYS